MPRSAVKSCGLLDPSISIGVPGSITSSPTLKRCMNFVSSSECGTNRLLRLRGQWAHFVAMTAGPPDICYVVV